MKRLIFVLLAATGMATAQDLNPSTILKPPPDSWPTYNGDYSGRRYSHLDQINAGTIKNLGLAWAYRANLGPGGAGANNFFGTQIKATPLLVDGVLYFTVPDHVWAVDARDGRELWSYKWETKGGIHIGNRGVGIYEHWLFFETPDNHLVSLDARNGKFRWSVEIADLSQEYFSTPAPIVIRNHVLVGIGGDSLDVPGYLEARDPETGAVQWHWSTTPRPGEPGAETWPDQYSMEHGGGMTWMPGTYDPELNLYYLGTGNPNPVHAAQSRKGDNLWTCSIVALNPDTGKLVWYFQVSPHDTHDWDAVQTPVLIDGTFKGEKRKMLAQAARNGYFFLLDRTTGKNLLTAPFMKETNWTKGIAANGQPIPNPEKEPKTDGVLVNPASDGNTNWPPPSFDPETGLFYVNTQSSFSVYYLTDTDPHPEGYGGRDAAVWRKNSLRAIDYKTGQIRWVHEYAHSGSLSGLLSTAGKLLFAGDTEKNFIAYDPGTGRILWHAGLTATLTNGAMTYMLDGRQYIVVGAGDMLYAFALNQ
ncbi:MAG TPA: acido-empty-quinoprotein group A [Bryobacteraceae bacterium]